MLTNSLFHLESFIYSIIPAPNKRFLENCCYSFPLFLFISRRSQNTLLRLYSICISEGNTEMKYSLARIKQLSDVPFLVRLTVFSSLPFFPSKLWNKEMKMIQVKQKFSAWKVHGTLLTEFFARQNGYQNIFLPGRTMEVTEASD